MYYATARTRNSKTGDVPTVWIGKTWDDSRRSCDKVKCPLRPWAREGETVCYAFGGTPAMAFASILRSGADYSIETALKNRSASARIIRVGAIGDPAILPKSWWSRLAELAKREKLQIVSYTHGWRKRPDLAGVSMASCDSLAQIAEAEAKGFRAAVATREMTPLSKPLVLPSGNKVVVCPAMASKARGQQTVTCNDCQLCVASKPGPHIVFPDHGPTMQGKR